MQIYTAHTVGYCSNCYMIVSEGKGAVIDPSVPLSEFNIPVNIIIEKVLLTHGHFDHILALESFVSLGAEVYVHKNDALMLSDGRLNASTLFGLPEVRCDVSAVLVNDGDVIPLGNESIKVFHTPGHTEGSVCFICGDVMFSGDTLFRRGIGRCDLPSGDYIKMRRSLARISEISQNLKVYPGHDALTTLDMERKHNYELMRNSTQNI